MTTTVLDRTPVDGDAGRVTGEQEHPDPEVPERARQRRSLQYKRVAPSNLQQISYLAKRRLDPDTSRKLTSYDTRAPVVETEVKLPTASHGDDAAVGHLEWLAVRADPCY
jgi:hypothetical protein